ncbi:hypothetical protein CDD82_7830 [Ophiocordyceps australis]|uniref:Peptidase M20 dimerisation domain-containing protein n=1 Tax=Ophiocordyceps australis TaxID=1399860 RepID=A0A2C5YQL7_9HYPO|nr:hypothetical protein CDD82_7830 [Ophiocordyceps australis]
MNLKYNQSLCQTYVEEMKLLGEEILLKQDSDHTASTDMGNVSHVVPTFHGAFGVDTEPGVSLHSREFEAVSAEQQAHDAAIRCGKGMAALALRVLMEDDIAKGALRDFKESGDSA